MKKRDPGMIQLMQRKYPNVATLAHPQASLVDNDPTPQSQHGTCSGSVAPSRVGGPHSAMSLDSGLIGRLNYVEGVVLCGVVETRAFLCSISEGPFTPTRREISPPVHLFTMQGGLPLLQPGPGTRQVRLLARIADRPQVGKVLVLGTILVMFNSNNVKISPISTTLPYPRKQILS